MSLLVSTFLPLVPVCALPLLTLSTYHRSQSSSGHLKSSHARMEGLATHPMSISLNSVLQGLQNPTCLTDLPSESSLSQSP